ncbi:MAG: ABA4-like family protein [Chitinophagaceae bacterium]|nr:ABA4-like family protein [Chitinophagaceae bacterium]
MSPETIFSVTNALALFSWIFLLLFPFRPLTNKVLIGVPVTLLAIAYAWLVFQSLSPGDFEKFQTLEGITSLFSVPGAVLVGWIHYLAFDLMAGLFIANNAAKHGIRHIVIVPCLIFTFMLGPVGLLLYLIIRWSLTKQWFADNF